MTQRASRKSRKSNEVNGNILTVHMSFALFSFRFLKEIEDFLQKQPMGHPHILPAAQFIIKLNTFN